MSPGNRKASLTRPGDPQAEAAKSPWVIPLGLALAGAGVMLLMLFFIFTAVMAGWVSDLHGEDVGNIGLAGRVGAWGAWLAPASVGAMALVKFGVAAILFGIVRNLWVRVEGLKSALIALGETAQAGR